MVVLKKVEYDLFKIKGSVLRTVRQSFNSFPMIVRRVIPGFLWFIAGIGVSFAQIATPPPGPAKQDAYDRTKAVPVEQSRAQQEADSLVSLSADKIVALLTDEPG